MLDVISSSRRRFSPLQLSPALWLDASDASTLYDATTGGSLVAADGVVARWEDKSGNARHATQSNLAYRPQRKTGIKNGKDVLLFSNNALAGSFVSSTQWTFFTVHVITSFTTNTYQRIFSQRFSGSIYDFDQVGHYIPILQDSATTQLGSWASSGMRSLATSTVNTWETRTSKHTGSVITNYRNNVSSADYSHTLGSNGFKYSLGAVGETPAGSNGSLIGNIAEVLAFPSVLSDTNRLAVESYLNTKWAVY